MLDLIWQIFRFVKSSGKYWIVPVVVVLLLVGALLVITQTTAIAPFIYVIF